MTFAEIVVVIVSALIILGIAVQCFSTFGLKERRLLCRCGKLAKTKGQITETSQIIKATKKGNSESNNVFYQNRYTYYVEGKQYVYNGFYLYERPDDVTDVVIKYDRDNPSQCYVVDEVASTLLQRLVFVVSTICLTVLAIALVRQFSTHTYSSIILFLMDVSKWFVVAG